MLMDLERTRHLAESNMDAAKLVQANAVTQGHYDVAVELAMKSAAYFTRIKLLKAHVDFPEELDLEVLLKVVTSRTSKLNKYPAMIGLSFFLGEVSSGLHNYGYADSVQEYQKIMRDITEYIDLLQLI